MKYFTICILFCLIACKNAVDEKDLEGVYVGHFEHEYALNDDTLLVSKASGGNNVFELKRQTGTIRKEAGKIFPKQYASETMMGTYDRDTHMITEMKNGRVFIWDKAQQQLQWGTVIYRKVIDR